jgi:tRNA modification GTPase
MYAAHTIAAVATPAGSGGIGIVRLSGPLTARIAGSVFARSHDNGAWISHHLYHGRVVGADGGVLDHALAVFMRAPHSYTGEDVLELHCHGSPAVLRRVLARVLSCGARLADRGEFTKRAFLNGRIDLAQAEAVADLVRAGTPAAADIALQQLSGALSQSLQQVRSRLIHVKALLEAQIDFSEEDISVNATDIAHSIGDCNSCINRLVDTYKYGRVMREGLRVAIIGKPNVGKSSLLNALLGQDRAIVTPLAGTTRDSIEESADFDGIPVVLSDTAGLRDPSHADPVERLGIERTVRTIQESDLLLAVLDGSRPLDAEDACVLTADAGHRAIIVLNKIDLPAGFAEPQLLELARGRRTVRVSATEQLGLAELRHAVVEEMIDGAELERTGPVLTNVRHLDALTKACESIALALQSIHDGRPPDIVAVDVQDALDHIGSITGAVTTEDVLDRIFSEFCIGK